MLPDKGTSQPDRTTARTTARSNQTHAAATNSGRRSAPRDDGSGDLPQNLAIDRLGDRPQEPHLYGNGHRRALVDAEKKLFLTAYHVIEGATEAKIYFPRNDADGRGPHCASATIIWTTNGPSSAKSSSAMKNAISRIALALRLPASVTVLPLAAKGAEVAQPRLYGRQPGPSAALSGLYGKAPSVKIVFKKSAWTTAKTWKPGCSEAQFPINQGDSGGPVVNDKGRARRRQLLA